MRTSPPTSRSSSPRPCATRKHPRGQRKQSGERGSLLADVEVGADVTVLRFENEAEELLHYLKDAGLDPGLEGKVSESDEEHVTIKSADRDHVITRSVAETVSVRADPAPPPRAAIPEQLVLSSDRYGR